MVASRHVQRGGLMGPDRNKDSIEILFFQVCQVLDRVAAFNFHPE